MDGLKAYQKQMPKKQISILKLFVEVFRSVLKDIRQMKSYIDRDDVLGRESEFEKIKDILFRFAQGFREENPQEQEWGELVTPLLIFVHEEIRKMRRYDLSGYQDLEKTLEDLIAFWESQESLQKQTPLSQSVPEQTPSSLIQESY